MPQTVRVEQFWVDRQKMIAYGRLSISFGDWNVEIFAPLGQVQPMIQLPGYYVSLDMVGEDGLRYAGVGLVESIELDRGPNGEARVSILGHGRLDELIRQPTPGRISLRKERGPHHRGPRRG